MSILDNEGHDPLGFGNRPSRDDVDHQSIASHFERELIESEAEWKVMDELGHQHLFPTTKEMVAFARTSPGCLIQIAPGQCTQTEKP